MEISSMLLERALDGVNELALPVAAASCLCLMLRSSALAAGRVPGAAPATAAAARPLAGPAPVAFAPTPSRRSRLLRRGVSALGLVMSVGSPASAAGRRHPPAPAAPEVRTEPGRFPPPRLPGSAGPLEDRDAGPPRVSDRYEPPWKSGDHDPRSHPVVHGGAVLETSGRLFGRWQAPGLRVGEPGGLRVGDAPRLRVGDGPGLGVGDRPGLGVGEPPHGLRVGKAEGLRVGDAAASDQTTRAVGGPRRSDGRTRAGVRTAAATGVPTERWHAVLPGETLWSIAAERLRTDDVRRIARYWPRIHRANRDEVGPNPNLIRPGQVLELPPEEA